MSLLFPGHAQSISPFSPASAIIWYHHRDLIPIHKYAAWASATSCLAIFLHILSKCLLWAGHTHLCPHCMPTKRDNMWISGRPASFLMLEMDCLERRMLITCELRFSSWSCNSMNFKQISIGTLNVHKVQCIGASKQMNYSDSVIL